MYDRDIEKWKIIHKYITNDEKNIETLILKILWDMIDEENVMIIHKCNVIIV